MRADATRTGHARPAKRRLRKKAAARQRAVSERDNPLHGYATLFVEWTLVTGCSDYTAENRKKALENFVDWCDCRSLTQPAELTRPVLEAYQRHLYLYRKTDGKPLGIRSQIQMLSVLRVFGKWLARERHILYNPAAELVMPRKPGALPKVVLTIAQLDALMAQPNIASITGLRERAMLEVLYSTGMRRLELAQLQVGDINPDAGTVMIRQGKGRQDRLIPVGERACHWVGRYLLDVRPLLVIDQNDWTLFLNDYGEPYGVAALSALAAYYMRRAGIEHGSCHALRHACATHMLENGADIRFIQVLLGHARLDTTQIYTRVAIGKLKAVHAATHPARFARPASASEQATYTGPLADAENAAQALLEALEAEASDEEPD